MNSGFWGKLKGRVDNASTSLSGLSIHRSEKDRTEDDTILSRAMLRYYKNDAPDWLLKSQTQTSIPVINKRLSVANPLRGDSSGRSSQSQSQARPSLDFMYQQQHPSSTSLRSSGSTGPAGRSQSVVAGPADDARRQRLGEKLRRANWS